MRLVFLPVNQRWVFLFGENIATAAITELADEPRSFQTRDEAIAAAARKGLTVDKRGVVS